MKKLLFAPALTLLSMVTLAQTSIQIKEVGGQQILAPNSLVNVAVFANTNVKVIMDIKNTSATTNTYNVKRYDVTLNTANGTDAEAYFCFGGSCYGKLTTISPTPLVLRAGKSASDTNAAYFLLTADLDEAPVAGLSVVKYTYFNVNNANDSLQVTLKYNGAVGIGKTAKDLSGIELYPNPATDGTLLKVNSVKSADSKITIYNSLGAVVSEKQVYLNEGRNNIELKVENYATGVYFVNVKSKDSSVTKRLIIQ